MPPRYLPRIVLAVASALACGAVTSPARADVVQTIVDPCGRPLTQPFLPWTDIANYALAPGGAAESAAGWSLAGGAAVKSGNEPFHVHGAADTRSIVIPAGGSARTAPTCIGLLSPTVRLFSNASTSAAQLAVDVVYTDALGVAHTTRIGTMGGATGWRPSPVLLLLANVTSLQTVGGTASVQLKFTAVGGQVRIDDVYVDPYKWR